MSEDIEKKINVYFSHPTKEVYVKNNQILERKLDFENDLYLSLKKSSFGSNYTFIFPHEISPDEYDTKKLFKETEKLIVVGYIHQTINSSGSIYELGMAYQEEIPVILMHAESETLSDKTISNEIIKVEKFSTDIEKLGPVLEKYTKKLV